MMATELNIRDWQDWDLYIEDINIVAGDKYITADNMHMRYTYIYSHPCY